MWHPVLKTNGVVLAGCALTLAILVSAVDAAEASRGRPGQRIEVTPDESEETAASALPESVKAERVLLRKPNDRQARVQAARAHLSEGAEDRGRVDAAHSHAAQVLSENPNDVEALLLAGQTSLLKNEAAAAARYYRLATIADANNVTAFLGLGDALTRLGDEAGATVAFARYRALMGMPPLVPSTASN